MSADLRVVLDTNVVISALLLRRSLTRQAFDHASSKGIVLVSTETVEELNDVLRRPKFEKYVGEEERMEFLTAYGLPISSPAMLAFLPCIPSARFRFWRRPHS